MSVMTLLSRSVMVCRRAGLGLGEGGFSDDGPGSWRNISFHAASADAEKMDAPGWRTSDLVNVKCEISIMIATHFCPSEFTVVLNPFL